MEKGINLTIFETKKKIVQLINESNLPIIVVRQIISELLHELSTLEQEQIKKEYEEFLKAQEKGEENGTIPQENMEK